MTSNYQINAPPPLGHPACQFPELTLLGVCGSLVIYFPSPPNATVDDLADVMAKVKHMPELRSAWVRAGVPPVMPPGHMRREVVTGSLGPIGRFRSPMPTRTNASTLHLYGLRAFAAWQVEATKGALWDAYAEVAIHMEILQVQLVAPGSANAKGAKASCSPEEGLCAPCGAVLDSPSVGLTFSYEYFDAIELHSDFERYRPVLTREFAEDLHSRGVDATAVRIEPALPLASADAMPNGAASAPMTALVAALAALAACGAGAQRRWRRRRRRQKSGSPKSSWHCRAALVGDPKSDMAADEALRGLLACEDISLCCHGDGSPWLLGCGAHGKVYRALRNGVQDAAVKLLTNVDAAHMAVFLDEVRLLKRISFDRNIVQFYGACLETKLPMLVMEYMGGGDLFSALQSRVQGSGAAHPLSWWQRGRSVALDIARGLHFLHSQHVVHNDLKTKNILLSNTYDIAKIADVGLARIMDASHLSTGLAPCGTFAYAAPELLMGRRCDEKVDIYSIGVVLWELVCRERPLRGHLRAPRVPEECPAAVCELIDSCIEAELPAQRPSAFEPSRAGGGGARMRPQRSYSGADSFGGGAAAEAEPDLAKLAHAHAAVRDVPCDGNALLHQSSKATSRSSLHGASTPDAEEVLAVIRHASHQGVY
ncbi:hypothetical protein WJX81_008121 [Elliptochloris bilobata]|uniref:Protein kinase domain-containing protein n=1 Tax=Elliptochloris bilobata TaxID=381761 RepID=A0AAW1RKN4_9CHLO